MLAVSGFEPGSTEEVIKGQLTTFFKSSGVIRKIFIPKDENTGQCLRLRLLVSNLSLLINCIMIVKC